jgi:serine/threonine protein kinase
VESELDVELPDIVFTRPPPTPISGPPRSGVIKEAPSRRESVTDGALPDVGAILDKYRLERLIGTGGFAVVYRATHLLLHTPVAIKMLRPKIVRRSPEVAMLLCEEARFAARIRHPNVVRVLDVTHTEAITYIVMDLVDGPTLARRIRRERRLSPSEVLRIGIDVALGLEAGLQQGLVHRDIKPANVLIATDGTAKIVDLGLALASEGSSGDAHLPGSVVGTPGYMAPEQMARPNEIDFRADIFSLGVTLYHASVGTLPLCAGGTRPPRPESILPDYPPAASSLIMWMLEEDRENRPPTYSALVAEMRSALAALQVAAGDTAR